VVAAGLARFQDFPEKVRRQIAFGLDRAAEGGKADNAKPMHGLEGGVFEITADDRSGTYRAVYALKIGVDHRSDPRADQATAGEPAMKKKMKDDELVRGSSDVFSDLGFADAPLMRLKSRVANEIVRALDRRGLSVRAAAKETGAAAADLSRIRNADLDRFTLDRLVRIAERLGCRVEIRIGKAA
jgi:predicted XRE-type DNA-binding protein